jgi:hypothetical protein
MTIFLNSFNRLMFVMVKCGVLFEVHTELLNIIYIIFSFKGFTTIVTKFFRMH